MKNYVITIARGYGSGGKEIGMKLSKELGIPCYERQILKMASNYSGINEANFVKADERLKGSYLLNALKSVPYSNIVSPENKEFTSNINLFNIQSEIIRELSRTQSCIIIGKCADYVLRDKTNVLSVYIEASRKDCIRSIMEKMEVTQEEAEKMIVKTDKYRADYYKYYTGGRSWTNPVNYDITLNSGRVGRDKCVKVIIDTLHTVLDFPLSDK